MSLEPTLVLLVLAAAVAHAAWNTLAKVSGERLATFTVVQGTPIILAACLAPFVAVPAAAAWPFLIASVVIHNGYFFFLMMAYKDGDLSLVYPLARGSAPLLVAVLAAVVAAEVPTGAGTAGIGLVSLGIASLAFANGVPRGDTGRPVLLALLTGLCIAAYTICDGLGTRSAGSPHSYTVWLFLLAGIPFIVVAGLLRRRRLLAAVAGHWKSGAVAGTLTMAAYALVLYAMSRGALAYVSALRETSVLFAAVIGATFLGEPFGGRRLVAAAAIVGGLIVLQIGG